MKISNNWLNQFIKTDISLEDKSNFLTYLGLEVEGIMTYESIKGSLNGIIVGEVIDCFKHPNADRLKVTKVDIGDSKPLQVICGAPNVRKGLKVALATVGTTLYGDDNSKFKIKKSKIRGELSNGMICSEKELNISDSHEGIMELDMSLKPGSLCSKIFDSEIDNIFEIGLTPNRADAMSHMGVARDLKCALIQNKIKFEWNLPSIDKFSITNNSKLIKINIEEKASVKRYFGITISNISISESNLFIKKRLKSIGLKPINNIVDITNYVLHELGQPLHAFDADKIDGKINVKKNNKKKFFETLDGMKIELSKEDIMICDDSKPLCLAGIIGGINSSVNSKTKNIFLESACFDPISIRKSAKRHNLNTDASYRFERGVDPEVGIYALKRAALLIQEYCGGEISSEIQEHVFPINNSSYIFLNFNKITQVIGHEIDKENLINILKSLEIEIVKVLETGFSIKIPSFRVDVTREIDVIEEILRVYGYSNIIPSEKLLTIYPLNNNKSKVRINQIISNQLINQGFYEVINNSLTSPNYSKLSKDLSKGSKVNILNPLGKELSELRSSLLFSLLEVLNFNINRQKNNVKIFENGFIYKCSSSKKYIETRNLALCIYGNNFNENWNVENIKMNFFNLKGYVLSLFERLGIQNLEETPEIPDYFSEGLSLYSEKKMLANFGLVNNEILKKFSLSSNVLFAEIFLEDIYNIFSFKDKHISSFSKYPSSKRDFSIMISENVTYKSIVEIAYKAENKTLKKIELFDVYIGNKLPKGKKSYGVSFFFQDTSKTLTDKSIDKIMEKLKKEFEVQLKAKLR